MSAPVIYTIGHSTHVIAYFLKLLSHYGVTCVVDVRSMPASRFNPQYNKKALAESLESIGVKYVHFGDAFGARQTDPALLNQGGFVDFEKVRNTGKFKNAIEELHTRSGAGDTLALMCSEAEPLTCHRFVMISVELKAFEVRHILKDMSFATQEELERALLASFETKTGQTMMFEGAVSDAEKLAIAYRMMNQKIAYTPLPRKPPM